MASRCSFEVLIPRKTPFRDPHGEKIHGTELETVICDTVMHIALPNEPASELEDEHMRVQFALFNKTS